MGNSKSSSEEYSESECSVPPDTPKWMTDILELRSADSTERYKREGLMVQVADVDSLRAWHPKYGRCYDGDLRIEYDPEDCNNRFKQIQLSTLEHRVQRAFYVRGKATYEEVYQYVTAKRENMWGFDITTKLDDLQERNLRKIYDFYYAIAYE